MRSHIRHDGQLLLDPARIEARLGNPSVVRVRVRVRVRDQIQGQMQYCISSNRKDAGWHRMYMRDCQGAAHHCLDLFARVIANIQICGV